MKIMFVLSASVIDAILSQNKDLLNNSYEKVVEILLDRGLFNALACNNKSLSRNNNLSIFNSEFIQKKWANEQGVVYGKDWKIEIFAKQIELFEPDVLYTNNPSWISKNIKKIPDVKLLAAWRAAPIEYRADYSCFDIGLSYAPVYEKLMKQHGIQHVEHMDLLFDPIIKKRLDQMNLKKMNDICFVGRYGKMFKHRNKLLYEIYRQFNKTNAISYHLLTEKRFGGLVPHLPWRMLNAVNKPVFLNELLEVFAKSKIVINCHSDIAGQYKGNMRVFEALGIGSFMLSDKGIYPKYLKDGIDFISYKDTNDLLNKIEYYLKNEVEREEIAKHGHETICKYYSTEIGSKKLKAIFEENL